MFANKKNFFATFLLTIMIVMGTFVFLSPQSVRADFGDSLLTFMGCDDSNNDGLNIEDCVSSGSGSGTVTDFTDFKGTLAAPDASGYASGLTQATDARTFILNVVNFALGFLGLIAVVIVIYGGVLMVTSAGGDGMGKGKKAITYAAIGLLVVMSSFALVNTILLAPSGSEKGGSGSSINTSTIRGVAGNARFNYLADQINTIILNVYNSYQFYLGAKQNIETAEANIMAFNSSACVVPMSNCVNQFSILVDGQLNQLTNLGNNPSANAKFTTGLAAYISTINALKNEKLPQISADISSADCNTDNKFAEFNPCTTNDLQSIRAKFDNLKKSISDSMSNTTNSKFLIDGYNEQLDTAAYQTAQIYQSVYGLASSQIGQQYFSQLIPAFAGSGGAAPTTTPTTTPNIDSYQPAADTGEYAKGKDKMGKYLPIGAPLTNIDQTFIKNILKALIQIKSILENIKFVDAVISADIKQGNAPLIVNFSSVGSKDPSGFGITDDRIEWDLNGDGDFSESTDAKCPEVKQAVASCIFSKPGTYRVTVRIKPISGKKNEATGLDWDQEIAPGISYIDILVNPPSTKINLTVKPTKGGVAQPVIKYDSKTQLIQTDADKVYFLLSQAQGGLTFDATKSTFSDGNTPITNDPSSKIRWNFGINSPQNDAYMIPSDKSLTLDQVYAQAGSYQVNFEVTDKNNVIDRKIFTLVVSNIAPIIANPPQTGIVGNELTFDGSESSSDGGPIIFNWKVEKEGGVPPATAFVQPLHNWLNQVAHAAASTPSISTLPPKLLNPTKRIEDNQFYHCSMPSGKDDLLKCTFKRAGLYKITLSLNDQDGVPREVSSNVIISSNPPTAGFKMVQLTPTVPALYKLDASQLSFDPDEKDNSNLEYSWEINPATCTLIGFADDTPDGDLIKSATDAFSTQTPCTKIKGFATGASKPVVKFTQKGDYAVNLVVRTNDEPNLTSDPVESLLNVDNILDVSWGEMKPSAILQVPAASKTTPPNPDQIPELVNTKPVAPITFTFNSSQAIGYDLDFGDGLSESGEMTKGAAKQVTHNYTKTGKFSAKLSVFDADDIENELSRNIFIGDSDNPVAIVTTKVNGSEIQPQTITLDGGTKLNNVIVVNRQDNILFDADRSLNTDGTGRRLIYSWNINNNEKQSTNKQVSHTFKNLSEKDQPYIVKLKVSNEQDASQNGEDSVNLLVIGAQPIVRSITAVPQGSTLTTPVAVNLNAVGASDPDGQIVQYKWWYYDAKRPPSPEERLGLQITTVPTASISIGTRGLEGETPQYAFGLEMTDNDNVVVSTDSQNIATRLNLVAPTVQVTNGPNKAPVARFTVDRTSVNVGETVNFASSSFDPDTGGGIKEYKWDFGDGSKGENKASVGHVYQKANVEGYRVKLTVVDSNFSEATSDSVRVFVDAQAGPPVAGFTVTQAPGSKAVKFNNTSTADEAAGSKLVRYSWDFDVNVDSNGDGKKDNDIDSGDQNPSHTYPEYGIFRAKLTVEDDQGQVQSVTNFVNVKPVTPTSVAGGVVPTDKSSSGGFSSATKTTGANLFVAGDQVDPRLLIVSMAAYAILLSIAFSKNKKNSQNK